MMTIRVILFGHLKDVFPQGKTAISLPQGATASDVANALGIQDDRLVDLLARTRVAVREEFAEPDTILSEGDEIAFLPPMSGG